MKCGAVAGAGVLVLGLVTAPQDIRDEVRTDIRAVHLTSATFPSATFPLAAPPRLLLEKFISDRLAVTFPASLGLPITPYEAAPAVSSSTLSLSVESESVADPAKNSLLVDDSDLQYYLEDLWAFPAYLAGLIVFGPIVVGILGAAVVIGLIQSLIAAVSPATASVSTFSSEPVSADSDPVVTTLEEPAVDEPESEPVTSDGPSSRTSADVTSDHQPVVEPEPTEEATEVARGDEQSSEDESAAAPSDDTTEAQEAETDPEADAEPDESSPASTEADHGEPSENDTASNESSNESNSDTGDSE